jgi:hypothetical protein
MHMMPFSTNAQHLVEIQCNPLSPRLQLHILIYILLSVTSP